MQFYRSFLSASAFFVPALIATMPTPAAANPGSGVTFTTLTVQNFLDPDQINGERIKYQTKDPTIVRIQSAAWTANSRSGWHHHPGVIIGVVASGTVTVWDGQCNQKTYGPGQALGSVFLEGDNMLMQATSSGGASEYVVHTTPFATPAVFRVEDDPPGCATAGTFRTPPHQHQ